MFESTKPVDIPTTAHEDRSRAVVPSINGLPTTTDGPGARHGRRKSTRRNTLKGDRKEPDCSRTRFSGGRGGDAVGTDRRKRPPRCSGSPRPQTKEGEGKPRPSRQARGTRIRKSAFRWTKNRARAGTSVARQFTANSEGWTLTWLDRSRSKWFAWGRREGAADRGVHGLPKPAGQDEGRSPGQVREFLRRGVPKRFARPGGGSDDDKRQ